MAEKTMTQKQAISRISDILNHARANYLANDGGLTMSACDLLGFGQEVVDRVEKGDIAYVMSLDPFNTDNGDEQEIIIIAQEWAYTV